MYVIEYVGSGQSVVGVLAGVEMSVQSFDQYFTNMETWNKLIKPSKAWARKICYCRVRSKICSQTSPDLIQHGWWWKESILDNLPGTGSREEDQQMTDDPACWASHFGFIRWVNKEVRVYGTQFLQNCLPLPILAIHNQYFGGLPKENKNKCTNRKIDSGSHFVEKDKQVCKPQNNSSKIFFFHIL